MLHPKHPTPMHTENSTSSGIINETLKQHRYNAIDMRFYWVRYICKQNHLLIYWAPGKYNMGDYHTKFHSPSHHKKEIPIYVHTEASPKYIPFNMSTRQQGCVKSFPDNNRINSI